MGTWSFRARKGGNYARTYVRARARAPPLAAAAGRARARAWVRVRVRVPYLDWFFLNQDSRYDPNQTRSQTRPDPLRQQLRTSWIANSREPIRQPTGANQLDCQRLRTSWPTKGCNGWVERLQPFVWIRTCWALLQGYIKDSMFSIEKHQQLQHQENTNLLFSL